MPLATAHVNLPVLAAGGGALVAWFVAVGLAALRNRPNEPEPGPATLDLGQEPPAVVNLLTSGFRVRPDAVPATLLDLAARGLVAIDHIGPAEQVVRVTERGDEAVTPYEAQVLDHVARVAAGGVVPAHALTTGPRDESRWWWARFRGAVVADAQARGLCVRRWAGVGQFWAAASVPALFLVVGLKFDLDKAFESLAGFGLFAGVLASGAVLVWITFSGSQRDTPEGLAAAGRWMGVRAALAENETLPTLPPSAVALWERRLAYAAATGLARAAVEGLPLGAEDDRLAWSAQGGRWRRVRVSYPRFRPGWGAQPGTAIALALPFAVIAGLVLGALAPFGRSTTSPLAPLLYRIEVGLGVVSAAVLLGALIAVGSALTDLGARAGRTGVVLRMRDRPVVKLNPWRKREKRRWYVAVDDGASERIAAWSVRPALYARVSQGDTVRAVHSPRLGFVEELEPVPAPAR